MLEQVEKNILSQCICRNPLSRGPLMVWDDEGNTRESLITVPDLSTSCPLLMFTDAQMQLSFHPAEVLPWRRFPAAHIG